MFLKGGTETWLYSNTSKLNLIPQNFSSRRPTFPWDFKKSMNWGFNEWGESTNAEMRERSGPFGPCPVCPEGTFQQNKWMGLETWANSQQPFTTLVIITSVVDYISCFCLKIVYDPKTSTSFPFVRFFIYNCTVNFKILFF